MNHFLLLPAALWPPAWDSEPACRPATSIQADGAKGPTRIYDLSCKSRRGNTPSAGCSLNRVRPAYLHRPALNGRRCSAQIIRNADGGREFMIARWGMPQSSKVLIAASKECAEAPAWMQTLGSRLNQAFQCIGFSRILLINCQPRTTRTIFPTQRVLRQRRLICRASLSHAAEPVGSHPAGDDADVGKRLRTLQAIRKETLS
jgi:hypothetical protein